jgi:hypothetical protein
MPTPDNAASPTVLRRHSRYVDDLVRIIKLTNVVVQQVRVYPQSIKLMEAVHALMVVEGESPPTDHVETARDLLPIVEAETKQGFPLFHGLAAIGVWGALEAFADDLLLDCLASDPEFSKVESVQKLKVSVADFGAMSEGARHAYILRALKVEPKTGGSPGLGGIERLFQGFGLVGSPSDELRACLVELNAVRNVLLHRSGVADERLVQLCPWLGLAPGDDVQVLNNMVLMYAISSLVYGTDLTLRLVRRYELPERGLPKFIESLEPGVVRTTASRPVELPPRFVGS